MHTDEGRSASQAGFMPIQIRAERIDPKYSWTDTDSLSLELQVALVDQFLVLVVRSLSNERASTLLLLGHPCNEKRVIYASGTWNTLSRGDEEVTRQVYV